MLDVIEIMRHPGPRFLYCVEFAAQSFDLGPPGDSGFDAMAMQILLDSITIELVARPHRDGVRTRTDERHIAAQYIDQLRQFVDAQGAHGTTDARDSRIAFYGALRTRSV